MDIHKIADIASGDQGEAGIRQMAQIFALFYRELVSQQVPQEHAIRLVEEYERAMIRKALWPDSSG